MTPMVLWCKLPCLCISSCPFRRTNGVSYSHCYENPETYNIDRNRIAVAGDSAGGNLAAAVTLMSRDHQGPVIKFQSLIYPALDIPRFFTGAYEDSPMLQ
jgi:acetyl esterase/lipase